MIPAQGLDTLRGFAEEMRNHGLSSSSAIAMALNLDLGKPNEKRAAQRIFTYFQGKLRGDASQGVSISDIVVWNEGATENSLSAAGQALANIIRDGVMPPGPIQELCALFHEFQHTICWAALWSLPSFRGFARGAGSTP